MGHDVLCVYIRGISGFHLRSVVECISTGYSHDNVSSEKALRGETEIEINDLPPIGGSRKEVPSVAEAEFMARTPRPTTPRPVIYG